MGHRLYQLDYQDRRNSGRDLYRQLLRFNSDCGNPSVRQDILYQNLEKRNCWQLSVPCGRGDLFPNECGFTDATQTVVIPLFQNAFSASHCLAVCPFFLAYHFLIIVVQFASRISWIVWSKIMSLSFILKNSLVFLVFRIWQKDGYLERLMIWRLRFIYVSIWNNE